MRREIPSSSYNQGYDSSDQKYVNPSDQKSDSRTSSSRNKSPNAWRTMLQDRGIDPRQGEERISEGNPLGTSDTRTGSTNHPQLKKRRAELKKDPLDIIEDLDAEIAAEDERKKYDAPGFVHRPSYSKERRAERNEMTLMKDLQKDPEQWAKFLESYGQDG